MAEGDGKEEDGEEEDRETSKCERACCFWCVRFFGVCVILFGIALIRSGSAPDGLRGMCELDDSFNVCECVEEIDGETVTAAKKITCVRTVANVTFNISGLPPRTCTLKRGGLFDVTDKWTFEKHKNKGFTFDDVERECMGTPIPKHLICMWFGEYIPIIVDGIEVDNDPVCHGSKPTATDGGVPGDNRVRFSSGMFLVTVAVFCVSATWGPCQRCGEACRKWLDLEETEGHAGSEQDSKVVSRIRRVSYSAQISIFLLGIVFAVILACTDYMLYLQLDNPFCFLLVTTDAPLVEQEQETLVNETVSAQLTVFNDTIGISFGGVVMSSPLAFCADRDASNGNAFIEDIDQQQHRYSKQTHPEHQAFRDPFARLCALGVVGWLTLKGLPVLMRLENWGYLEDFRKWKDQLGPLQPLICFPIFSMIPNVLLTPIASLRELDDDGKKLAMRFDGFSLASVQLIVGSLGLLGFGLAAIYACNTKIITMMAARSDKTPWCCICMHSCFFLFAIMFFGFVFVLAMFAPFATFFHSIRRMGLGFSLGLDISGIFSFQATLSLSLVALTVQKLLLLLFVCEVILLVIGENPAQRLIRIRTRTRTLALELLQKKVKVGGKTPHSNAEMVGAPVAVDDASKMEEHTEETTTCVFNPGEVGLHLLSEGVVSEVTSGGQAERLGVKSGWQMVKLEDSAFSTHKIEALIAGSQAYSVTFRTEAYSDTFPASARGASRTEVV